MGGRGGGRGGMSGGFGGGYSGGPGGYGGYKFHIIQIAFYAFMSLRLE